MFDEVTILDGGMGRELLRMGAPFRQPEWSALALMEAPEFVGRAHRAYVEAGAQVVTSNSYAVVPFHIGEERFAAQGQQLAGLAGRIAREAAGTDRRIKVAASLPPLFGSYRPDLFQPERAPALLEPLIQGLAPHADLWLAETLASIQEATAVRRALGDDPRPLWISFTLAERLDDGHARLRSGESVKAAAVAVSSLKASALLFNCSPPEVMEAAVREAAQTLAGQQIRIGVYANAFVPADTRKANSGLSTLRDDEGPEQYRRQAQAWVDAGATIVGGCCGIGPEHIAALAQGIERSGMANGPT